MKRKIINDLLKWKNQSQPLPLLLRGARQVGKTYVVNQFGNSHFENVVTINFELQREYLPCFSELLPEKIINMIIALSKQPIIPKKTLLFLDEIQECPKAIMALRYFKEIMPDLQIIGAGSLLEFTLNDFNFRMPVGRIQSLFLKPLSFHEYLLANQYENLYEYIAHADCQNPIPQPIHEKLLQLVHEYFVLGGMPAVITHYLENRDLNQAQILQLSLLNTYRSDFGKYANLAKHKYLQKVFDQTPGMIGEHFRYVKIDPHMQARDIRDAIEYLRDAGLLYPIYCTQASGLPLTSLINEKKFKLLFLDIGLVKAASLLDAELMMQKNLMLVNQGMLAEQFVGQELLAYMPKSVSGQLFYWEREAKSSTAEVDYVVNVDEFIIPIEVKSGKTGSLKSMRLFLEEKKSILGVRISQKNLSYENNILSIPLYMISELKKLVLSILLNQHKHAT